MSRIVTNTNANTVFKNYTRNEAALSSSLEKLSTGLRINRASDDPAGLAISETLRSQVKGSDAAVDVIANATNFINTVDGYLQNVNDILGRLQELAVAYNDGTKSTADKANLDAEAQSLVKEMVSYDGTAGSGASFNGASIFDNSGAAPTPIGGGANPVIYNQGDRLFQTGANAGNEIVVKAQGLFSITSQLQGLNTVGGVTQTAATSTLFTDINVTITGQTTGTLDASLQDIQNAIAYVSSQRASLGGDQSQLNFSSKALTNYSENASAAEGRIRNADIAKESSMFSRNQILVQASTAMLAQANQSSQNVLSLLK